jgi:Fe-S cluster assembly protein SufD
MATQPHALQPFVSAFDPAAAGLPGAGLGWLRAMRKAGLDRFTALGLPTTRLESWKYTRLKPLEDTRYRPVTDADGAASIDAVPTVLAEQARGPRMVFVNGRLRPDLSTPDGLPKGVRFQCLRDMLAGDPDWVRERLDGAAEARADQPLVALNAAMMDSGFVLRVSKGVRVEQPIEVVFIGGLTDEPVASFPRNLIVLEEGARATVVKHYAGRGVGAYLTNAVTQVDVGPGASLGHYRLQAETRDATHLSTVRVRIDRDATYDGFSLAISGRLSRSEVAVRLAGRGAHCGLNGAYLMRGSEHCDNTTLIEHLVPDTTCREVFKGVLDDESRAVFQGKIVVHKDAQRSDGHQLCKTLLLSTGAEIDAKPELEIYADDVKCSHGATTGQMDERALFYLRSRGVPEALARNLLVQSFLGEALDEIKSEDVRAALTDKVVHSLPAVCFLAEEWRT